MDTDAQAALTELEGWARQREDRETAWRAADTVIEVLVWRDEMGRAADLAEHTMLDPGLHNTGLVDERAPFGLALAAAEVYMGVPAASRLHEASSALPTESVLGAHVSWMAKELQDTSARDFLARNRPWQKRSRNAARIDRELLARDWSTLSYKEVDLLWSAAQRMNDFDLACQILGTTGTYPTRWQFVSWFATWLVHKERADEASTVLLACRESFHPATPWEVLPVTAPVDPDLRRAVTPEVRQAYLEQIRNPFPLEQV